MNRDIRWGIPSDGHTFPIYAGPADDLVRVAEFADERGVTHIRFGGDTWDLSLGDATASAKTQTGEWTAAGNGESFAKSDRYRLRADRHELSIVAESRNNFVLDIEGEKAGQFTSAGRGLRNLHVEFEGAGESLPLDVQVFVSWVARSCMESRVMRSTWGWTLAMLICIPILLFVYFAGR